MVEEAIVELEDGAESAALFSSGMAAISTVGLAFLKPGDKILASMPVYGGTECLFQEYFSDPGRIEWFPVEEPVERTKERITSLGSGLRLVYLESPANPTNLLADVQGISEHTHQMSERALVVVDNTVLGPYGQSPLSFGADLVVYSATKSLGGHSSVIAGLVVGSNDLVAEVRKARTFFGSIHHPFASWLLREQLSTYRLRAKRMQWNAGLVAQALSEHSHVKNVLTPDQSLQPEQSERFRQQCRGPGHLVSFLIEGSKEDAFKVINSLQVIKRAVSLGSVTTLVTHPASTTHSEISPEKLIEYGVTDNLIRLSVGLETPRDLINDLHQALATIE